MKDSTLLVRERIDYSLARPIATPIFQTSAFKSGDPNFYTRNTNPNFEDLENLLAKLDNTKYSVLLSSGMAAIASVLHLLKPGDELISSNLIYGCTHRLLSDFCEQMKISLRFVNLSNLDEAKTAISKNTTMVFFETPTNPFLKTIGIKNISELLKSKNPEGLVVVDNTWATPLYQKPLNFGADISLYSGSKFFSGHSDVIIGAVTVKDNKLYEKIKKYRFYQGATPDAFSAWLTRRGMATLDIRLERHQESTKSILNYLENHRMVTEVFFPKIDGIQLTGYGCLLFFRMKTKEYSKIVKFMDNLTLFDQGTSMASVASAVANPFNGSHLSMSAEEKNKIGLDEFVIRLSIGLESVDDLIFDLDNSLSLINID